MSLYCDDSVPWLMLFNYQLKIHYQPENLQYMNTTNIGEHFQPVANRSCIHYIKALHSDAFHHLIMQSLFVTIDRDIALFNSLYFISITTGIECEYINELYTFHSSTVSSNHSDDIVERSVMTFHGPAVYFHSMYFLIDVKSPLKKECDVVLNFQLVSEKKTIPRQNHCHGNYMQVSYGSVPMVINGGTIS